MIGQKFLVKPMAIQLKYMMLVVQINIVKTFLMQKSTFCFLEKDGVKILKYV